MVRVESDHHDDDVLQIVGLLAEANDFVVIDSMKPQAAIAVQRAIFAPNPVYPGDEFFQAVGAGDVPTLDLVLFRIEIFLAAGFTRDIFAKLEAGP